MASNNPITGEHPADHIPDEEPTDLKMLKLKQIRGFNGTVMKGLTIHPDGNHFVFAMGSNIIVEEITARNNGKQDILSKHNGDVTTLTVSPDGRFIVSGDRAPVLHAARVILWDFATRQDIMNMTSHKTSIAHVTFLYGSHQFVTLGDDDDPKLTLWSSTQRMPKVTEDAQPARSKATKCLEGSKIDSRKFITGGWAQGRLWTVAEDGSKLEHKELNFGQKRHNIISIEVADKDCSSLPMAFCGTSSGDILIFSMANGNLQASVPKKPISSGVSAISFVRMMDNSTFNLIVGTGGGKVMNYDVTMTLDTKKKKCMTATAKLAAGTNVWSYESDTTSITSIVKRNQGNMFYVASWFNHIYEFNLYRWTANLIRTNSNTPVYALAFARGTDDLLVTGERGQVRVINLQVNSETRRYVRQNRTCYSVIINHDGTLIFTGWDNGDVIVLGFEPNCMTLKEVYRIDSAQKQPVTALALTSDSSILITGGGDGQTRVWRLVDDVDLRGRRLRQALLLFQLTSQSGQINTIEISQDDQKCLSSSNDGSAVVYDLSSGHRTTYVKWDTSLNAACFVTHDVQLLTASGDGVLRYWEVSDGSLLRQVEGSKIAINTLCMRGTKCPALQQFATGADDGLVRVWDFEKAEVTHVGKGHSGGVIKSKFGPCGTILVTSSRDGALFIWNMLD